jgi:hypothetical protein
VVWKAKLLGQKGWRKIIFYILGVLATTIIASIATLPFTIYHFHRFTLQSIAANLVVIPLMGFWIMPLALAAMLTTGIPAVSEWFLQGMGYGIDIMIYIATIVAHWPGAAIYVPQTSPGFLYCILGGGLWLCLWQEKCEWHGGNSRSRWQGARYRDEGGYADREESGACRLYTEDSGDAHTDTLGHSTSALCVFRRGRAGL